MTGHVVEIAHDPTMTYERYVEALNVYRDALKKAAE